MINLPECGKLLLVCVSFSVFLCPSHFVIFVCLFVCFSTVLVFLYGLFLGLSYYLNLFTIGTIILLCVMLYIIYMSAAKSTLILRGMVSQLDASIAQAEKTESPEDPTTNIPLLKSEREHYQSQIQMLTWVVFQFILVTSASVLIFVVFVRSFVCFTDGSVIL